MSPEQATAEKDLTNRSDIYSLGSVLYEMLTGSPPHTGASVQQIIMKIVTEDAAPVTSMRKSVPANVAAAVAMALEKLPADRFESARAFAEALGNRGFAVAEIPRAGVAAPLVPRSRTTTLALAGLATSALALAAWGWLRPRAEPRVRDSWRVALPVPDSIGISGSPSLSSDGTTIAYVGGDSRVWILRADGSPATPIAGTEGAYAASIAPDGARVAFLRNGGLELVPVAGGPPTRISDSTQFSEPAAWIDNSTLAFATLRGLMTISTSGGPITPLTTLDHDSRGMWHVHPEALPGGRGVIFSIQPGDLRDASLSRIAVVGPDGGVPTVLMPGLWASYAEPGHLLVTQANGSIVAVPFDLNSLRVTGEPVSIVSGLPIGLNAISGNFSVAPTGRLAYVTGKEFTKTDLVRVRRDGTSIPIDTSRTGNFTSVAASPDGRWVAGTIEAGSPDELRLRDLTTGAQVRITLPSTWLRMPAFLPDGRSLVFTGIGPQQSGLYRVRAGDAAAPELLFSTGRDAWPYWPSASADGQTIFYTLRSAGHRKVFAHHLGDSAAADRDIFETRDHVSQAVSSPDGRWLAYLTDESGRTELSVRPANLARAERWQVPRPAGAGTGDPTSPRWSRDSREIVYRSGNRMVSARVAPGPSFAVTEQHVLFPAPDYEPSFDLFPNGDLLMIRKRPATGTQLQLIMVDRWNSGIR
jgi:serine/threonine-protein kinase